MKLKTLLIAASFVISSCRSEAATPTVTPYILPSQTPLATVNTAPTAALFIHESPTSVPSARDVFGAIPLNSVQAFSIEPIAKAIFDQTLQAYVTTGTIQDFRVDRIAVLPSGNGGLIAEIMYSLRTDQDPWPEDFGTLESDGWIHGKCSRFDLIATDTEHQLINKRLCS